MIIICVVGCKKPINTPPSDNQIIIDVQAEKGLEGNPMQIVVGIKASFNNPTVSYYLTADSSLNFKGIQYKAQQSIQVSTGSDTFYFIPSLSTGGNSGRIYMMGFIVKDNNGAVSNFFLLQYKVYNIFASSFTPFSSMFFPLALIKGKDTALNLEIIQANSKQRNFYITPLLGTRFSYLNQNYAYGTYLTVTQITKDSNYALVFNAPNYTTLNAVNTFNVTVDTLPPGTGNSGVTQADTVFYTATISFTAPILPASTQINPSTTFINIPNSFYLNLMQSVPSPAGLSYYIRPVNPTDTIWLGTTFFTAQNPFTFSNKATDTLVQFSYIPRQNSGSVILTIDTFSSNPLTPLSPITCVRDTIFYASVVPVLLSFPTNGAQNIPVQPIFQWQPFNQAALYDVYYGTDSSNLQTSVYDMNLINTNDTVRNSISFNTATTYFWKVYAKDINGNVLAYSPIDSFTIRPAINMSIPRFAMAGAVVGNNLYIGGGYNYNSSYLNTLDIFNTASQTWTTLFNPNGFTPRQFLTATTIGTKIYFAGGNNGNALNIMEVFDTMTNQFSTPTTTGIFTPRYGLTSAGIGNNIYLAGGSNMNGYLDSFQIFNTQQNKFTSISPVIGFTARTDLAAISLGTKIFLAGGNNGDNNVLSTFEVFDTVTRSFSTPSTIGNLTARRGLVATNIGTRLYFAGGSDNNYLPLNTFEFYDTTNQTWTSILNNIMTPRSSLVAMSVGNNIYLIGGIGSSNANVYGIVEIYNTQLNQWQ